MEQKERNFNPLLSTPALYHDCVVHLLADHDLALPARPEGVDHDVIAEHVKLLLILALDICIAGKANEVDQPGSADVGGYIL